MAEWQSADDWQAAMKGLSMEDLHRAMPAPAGLGDGEIEFLCRDSFSIASVVSNGWPYVKHRVFRRGLNFHRPAGGFHPPAGLRSKATICKGAQVSETIPPRPPLPPFDLATARQKVLMAEAAWNTRDPQRVAAAYTVDSEWRNRSEFLRGHEEIVAFLERKWARELDYALRKELWAFTDRRIAVRFRYEWHDADGQWYRSYGNENWEFDDLGYMRRREASINDVPIDESERRIFGPRGESDDHRIPLR